MAKKGEHDSDLIPSAPLSSGGMVLREKEPVNLEMPFHELSHGLTPVDRFFVRCHHQIPRIDRESWRLKILGEVETPLELSLTDLLKMEQETRRVTLECAGNGRAFLVPQRDGAQWENGAVGTADWTGVPLGAVLKRAGLKASAIDLVLEGADVGEVEKPPRPQGKIHYARSLPPLKASRDVLLAHQMNGSDLLPEHGFPLRAIVPGWYGAASVKWLTQIVARSEPYHGYYQTTDYSFWQRGSTAPTLLPIQEMRVKAQIARPALRENVKAGTTYRVQGAAWTTDAEITRVEVSTDQGETWADAKLESESKVNAWRLWEYDWKVPAKTGLHILMARATDSQGRTQPQHHHDDRGSYLIHHWLPVEVWVR